MSEVNQNNNQNLEPEQLEGVAGGVNVGSKYDPNLCKQMPERAQHCLFCSARKSEVVWEGVRHWCTMGFFNYTAEDENPRGPLPFEP